MYMLDPDTDELQPKVKIEKTVNEDGREENVWANGKTYYSYTLGEGLQTVMNPDNYKDSVAAARAALTESNIPEHSLRHMTECGLVTIKTIRII